MYRYMYVHKYINVHVQCINGTKDMMKPKCMNIIYYIYYMQLWQNIHTFSKQSVQQRANPFEDEVQFNWQWKHFP